MSVTVTQTTTSVDVTATPMAVEVTYPGLQGAAGPTLPIAEADVTGLTSALAAKAATAIVADSMRAWGHSYVSGSGATDIAHSFPVCLAERLGVPLRNEGIGGTGLWGYLAGEGPYTAFLQKLTRPGGFVAPGGFHVIMYGINDCNTLGNTGPALQPYKDTLRLAVSRCRAGAVFESSDPSVTLGGAGSWSTVASGGYGSGLDIAYNVSSGATITITTPADFPGGTIALGLVAWPADGAGCVLTSGTINGQTYTLDTRNPQATNRAGYVLRIPGLPAGTASYVFTSTLPSSTGCMFDYWQWEVPPADAPLVVIVDSPKPIDYTPYGSVAPGPPTDAGIDAINTINAAIAEEFDSRVITVDTSSIDKSATYFTAGDIHPNNAGHRIIAEAIATAVKSAFTILPSANQSTPRTEYGTAAPTTAPGAATNWYVGDRVVNTAPSELGSAASKYVITGWVCTVAGAPGTWLPTRTLTGN